MEGAAADRPQPFRNLVESGKVAPLPLRSVSAGRLLARDSLGGGQTLSTRRGPIHASLGFLSLRCSAVHAGVRTSLPVQSLLLLDLPEDGRRRRLRHQPRRVVRNPVDRRQREPAGLPSNGPVSGRARSAPERRKAPLLWALREPPLDVGSPLARPGS